MFSSFLFACVPFPFIFLFPFSFPFPTFSLAIQYLHVLSIPFNSFPFLSISVPFSAVSLPFPHFSPIFRASGWWDPLFFGMFRTFRIELLEFSKSGSDFFNFQNFGILAGWQVGCTLGLWKPEV